MHLASLVLALALCAPPAPALAAAATVSGPRLAAQDELDLATIEQRLAAARESTALDEATRKFVVEQLEAARASLQLGEEHLAKTREFDREIAEVPERLATIRAELAQPPAKLEPDVPADADLRQLEQLLARAEADLAAQRKQADEIRAEATRREERRLGLPGEIASLRTRVEELDASLLVTTRPDEQAEVAAARRASLTAERRELLQEVQRHEAELRSYDARRELILARRDRANRRVLEAEGLVARWQQVVGDRRRLESERAAQEAERARLEAVREHPSLKPIAEANRALAVERSGEAGLSARIARATERLTGVRERLGRVERSFATSRRLVTAAGLTEVMGLHLRKEYESLPRLDAERRNARSRAAEIADAQAKIILYQAEREEVGDVEKRLHDFLAQLEPDDSARRQDLERAARELFTTNRELLETLSREYETYFQLLLELEAATSALVSETEQYREYIEERILWVRSVTGARVPQLGDMRRALSWLLSPSSWTEGAASTASFALHRWLTVGGLALLFAVALLARRWSRRELSAIADKVGRFSTDSYRLTVWALCLTVVAASPWPVLLFSGGWLLKSAQQQPDVFLAAGAGLEAVARFLVPYELLRQIVRPRGLADVHFRWPTPGLRSLGRHVTWFLPVAAVAVFLVVTFAASGEEAWDQQLGRAVFSLGMLPLAFLLQRVLRADGPVLRQYLALRSDSLVVRLHKLWYGLAVLAPIAAALLAAAGYYYTALKLGAHIHQTLVLLFGLLVLHALLMRWLFLARRRLAYERARRKREEEREQAERVEGSDRTTVPLSEPTLDIPDVDAQTRKLFRSLMAALTAAGLFFIWSSVLPALKILDRVQLWPEVRIVQTAEVLEEDGPRAPVVAGAAANGGGSGGGEASASKEAEAASPALRSPAAQLLGASGAASDAAAEEGAEDGAPWNHAVTLADVLLALLLLALTVLAAQNVPGLLEITLLPRLPLDAGARYATATVARYTITLLGVTIAFGAIGVGWVKVQWLAAALTFGLAFGLQEIFANFVSGLIILFERPFRLGDLVTVGNVDGRVTRIRMRATTITDWDRRELLVPNKEFITGSLVNWTLTDPITRVVIPVGIAYGSDTEKAHRLLLRAARESRWVLDDPAPNAIFKSFGDSALLFDLRVHMADRDHWPDLIHDLHMRIDRLFRAEEIEIAFPQMDLHLRTARARLGVDADVHTDCPVDDGGSHPLHAAQEGVLPQRHQQQEAADEPERD